jgi:hypothetical protein
MKTVKEHLKRVVLMHQKDWNERLPIFLLTCRASTHETTGTMPASMVFWRQLCLHCDLLFWTSPKIRSSLQLTTWLTLWISCITHIITHVNIWMWLMTGRRTTMTAWLIPQDSRKGTKSGCITHPRQEESCQSYSHYGKVHTRRSPRWTMWSTWSRNVLGQRWWWYTWTGTISRGYSGQEALRR